MSEVSEGYGEPVVRKEGGEVTLIKYVNIMSIRRQYESWGRTLGGCRN